MEYWFAELYIFDRFGNELYNTYQVVIKIYRTKITLRYNTDEMRIEDMDLQESWFNTLLERELRSKERSRTVIRTRSDTNMSGEIVLYTFAELKKHLEFYKVIVNQNKKNLAAEREEKEEADAIKKRQEQDLAKDKQKKEKLYADRIKYDLLNPYYTFCCNLNVRKRVEILIEMTQAKEGAPKSLFLCLIKTQALYYAYIGFDAISYNVVASESTLEKLFETIDKMETICIIDKEYPMNTITALGNVPLKDSIRKYKASYIEKLECRPTEAEIALFARYAFEQH